MGKSATNISIVLGLMTIAFAGYYIYTQNDAASAELDNNEVTMENMRSNTRVFIEHRQVLDQIELNVGFFEDERFRSLRKFTRPIQDRPIGRPDPFADTTSGLTGF